MKAPEEIILSNAVGTITKQTVKIKPAKGGPLTINMADILSITYQLKRRYFLAALSFLFGLGSLLVAFFPVEGNRISISSFFVPAILIIVGFANLLGYYIIEIRTKTAKIKLDDVEFTKLKAGRNFIQTLEKMIPENKTTIAK
jgi:hypothetical protein